MKSNAQNVQKTPNKTFKPLAMLARPLGTPHRIAHGFAIVAQPVLPTERRLTGRWVCKGRVRCRANNLDVLRDPDQNVLL